MAKQMDTPLVTTTALFLEFSRDKLIGQYWPRLAKMPKARFTAKSPACAGPLGSTAYRIRTGVTAVRGRRPRPLDECGPRHS